MAFAGYAYERTVGSVLPNSLANVAMTSIYARGQVLEYAGADYLNQSCVAGGSGGISFAGSSVMEDGDIIDINVSYRVKPFAGVMGFDGFAMAQRYYGKAWARIRCHTACQQHGAGGSYGICYQNRDGISLGQKLYLFKSVCRICICRNSRRYEKPIG